MDYQTTGETIKTLLTMAWLLPLLGFAVEIFAGYWQRDRLSKAAAQLAFGCIGLGFLFSSWALMTYVQETGWTERFEHESAHHAELVASIEEGKPLPGHGHGGHHDGDHHEDGHHDDGHHGDDAHHEEEHQDEKQEKQTAITAEDAALAQFAIADDVHADEDEHHEEADHGEAHDEDHEHADAHPHDGPAVFSGTYYRLASFGNLEINSPFNTYFVNGLPVGPIANPGLDSIQAIATPLATNFYYFVSDCSPESSGTHIFSATFEEHLANVERCQ